MTIFVGEDVEIRVKAFKPTTLKVVANASVVADFYAPDKDPIGTPSDRTSPAHSITLTYVPAERAYVGIAETIGWTAGKWTTRAVLGGGDSVAYSSFTLHA